MATSSSCHKCGAKLVPGAEICDLCGTLVSADGASVPDWIDAVDKVVPAYRTIPDPIRPKDSSARVEKGPDARSSAASVTPHDSGGTLSVEPEEDFFDRPAEEVPAEPTRSRAPRGDAGDVAPIEVVAEEDFFSSDSADSETSDAEKFRPSDLPTESRTSSTQIVEEENFFSTDPAADADVADVGSTEEGPSEMELAKSAGSFQQADFVEAEDFFGGGADEIEAAESPSDSVISEMDQARRDGSIERADVAEAEDFFSDTSSFDENDAVVPAAPIESKSHALTSNSPAVPGIAKPGESEVEQDARNDRAKKGRSRKQKNDANARVGLRPLRMAWIPFLKFPVPRSPNNVLRIRKNFKRHRATRTQFVRTRSKRSLEIDPSSTSLCWIPAGN